MEAHVVQSNALDMALGTGPVVKAVLIILIACSVISWTIIFAKWFTFARARKESNDFLDLFWNAKSLEAIFGETKALKSSPLPHVFRAGYLEFQKLAAKGQEASEKGGGNAQTIIGSGLENVERALRKAYLSEMFRLERLTPWLATIASVAPFIGLFGTVWGIMTSFQGLSSASAGGGGGAMLERVAPGISEALIATAVGLAAAIPAVVFYNNYVQRMKGFRTETESFASDFTNILKRNYLGS
jgi:biopolymer transport protein TolQ